MKLDLSHGLVLEASRQMDRWYRTGSRAALKWLLANRVLYSEPRTPNNAVGWFGEFVIELASGGVGNRFAGSIPDVMVPGKRHHAGGDPSA